MNNVKPKNNFDERNSPDSVSFIVYEAAQARSERTIKRLWIALLVTISLLAISNVCWLYYESQFETISYSQDGEGLNNINTGTQGDLYGTESTSAQTEKAQSEENTN